KAILSSRLEIFAYLSVLCIPTSKVIFLAPVSDASLGVGRALLGTFIAGRVTMTVHSRGPAGSQVPFVLDPTDGERS
ncbi:Hypothetical predicted protein, partial [Olea europaea subsp. europaea]